MGSNEGPAKQNAATARHEEHQYLDLVRDILDNGEHRPDRSDLKGPQKATVN